MENDHAGFVFGRLEPERETERIGPREIGRLHISESLRIVTGEFDRLADFAVHAAIGARGFAIVEIEREHRLGLFRINRARRLESLPRLLELLSIGPLTISHEFARFCQLLFLISLE